MPHHPPDLLLDYWTWTIICINLHCQKLCSHLISHTYYSASTAIINYMPAVFIMCISTHLHYNNLTIPKHLNNNIQILALIKRKMGIFVHILWLQLIRELVSWKLESFGGISWGQTRPCGGSNTFSHKRSGERYTWKELRVYFLAMGITIIKVLKSMFLIFMFLLDWGVKVMKKRKVFMNGWTGFMDHF